jgi:pSer/pThr/pTyr-binding forkhead associated (FHA) protein
MRALLVPLDGSRPIELTKDMTLVGRKDDCDLRLDHKSVSKLHCVIVKTDGLLLLRDLGSTNSTRVNGQRIRRAALLPDDQLTIANYKFRVQLGAGGEPAPPDDHTQQLDAKEVVKLLNRAVERAEDDDLMDAADEDGRPAQPAEFNPLPDAYPEERPNRKGK